MLTLQLLVEVLLLLLRTPKPYVASLRLFTEGPWQVRLQLLENLELELHEWRGSNDKQKKKNVGQV
jgi:hypothetical protein